MAEQKGTREVVVATELLRSQSDKNRCHAFPFPHTAAHLERTHARTRARAHTLTNTEHIQHTSWCLLPASFRQTCHRSSWPVLPIISGEQPMTG